MLDHSTRLLLTLAALGGLGPLCANAQSLVLIRNGQLQSGNFGVACDAAGTIDAGNIPDFVVGASRTTPNQQSAGTGTAHSGSDGAVLYEYNGNTQSQFLGFAVAGLGDLNADGRGDFAICTPNEDLGASNAGRARIYSGVSGNQMYSFIGVNAQDNLGFSVDGAGFVNGDGRPDIIVGVPGDDTNGNAPGAAIVYSGLNGQVLYTFRGTVPGASFGASVSKAGDVDNDGRDDVMVGTPFETGATTRGRVVVYSGRTGNELYTFLGSMDDVGYGGALAGPGDLNGDGHAELVVGARAATVNGIAGGAVYVYSGIDGSVLYTIGADSPGSALGLALGDGGDADGDGTPDFVIGAPHSSEVGTSSGHVRVISGATGAEFFRVFGESSSSRFGTSCAIIGDVSGNGLDDILVGAPGAIQQRGRCYIYEFDGLRDDTYCDVASNSSGQVSLISAAGSGVAADQDLTLTAVGLPSVGAFGLFFLGPDQVQSAFGDGFRCVGGSTQRVQPPIAANGARVIRGTLDFNAQYAAPIVAGADLNFQLWYRDPMAGMAGFNLSNAIHIAFQ